MADDLNISAQQDRLRININEPHEVRYWTQKFGCEEQKLRDVVASVGVMAADVEAILDKPS